MKKLLTGIAATIGLLMFSLSTQATSPGGPGAKVSDLVVLEHGPGLQFSAEAMESEMDLFKRKKRRRKRARTLGVGLVVGGPVGLGARGLLRLGSFGISGDLAYNRLRSDSGPLVDVFTSKVDARFYSKSFFGKLLRFYVFAGGTMQRGLWDGEAMQSAFLMDAGLGGGIKISRVSVNAEVGLLIPAVKLENYKPGFGAFANVAVLIWLF